MAIPLSQMTVAQAAASGQTAAYNQLVSGVAQGTVAQPSVAKAVAPGGALNPAPVASNNTGSNISSQISTAANVPSGTSTSPVITSKTAQTDYTAKYAAYQSALDAMNQQTDLNQKAQAQATLTKAQNDLANTETGLKQQGVDIQKMQAQAALETAQAKKAAAEGLTSPNQGTAPQGQQVPLPTGNQTTPQVPPAQTTTPSADTQNYVNNVQGIQDERTTALNSFLQTANSMIIGLQASESALVNATTQQFNNIITAQQQSNASQLGAATEAAARGGQEYNPTGSGSTIANVISQGNQRLSEINSTMAKTIADLNVNFAKEEYSMMNDNFAKLDKNFADRMSTFKDVHDAVAADAKSQMDAQKDARDFSYKQEQDKQAQDLAVKKYQLDVNNSAVDNQLKRANIASIYSKMSSDNLASANSWVANIKSGSAKLSDVPANLKNAVSAGLANGNAGGVSDILQTTKASLDELNKMVTDNHGFTGAVGFKGIFGAPFEALTGGPAAGGQVADFAAKAKQVVNDIVLPNLTILHGLGRITDREFQALQSAITSLSIDPKNGTSSLSEETFKTELKNITDRIDAKITEANTHSGITLPGSEPAQGAGAFQGITLPN